jgi:hypothetical protein
MTWLGEVVVHWRTEIGDGVEGKIKIHGSRKINASESRLCDTDDGDRPILHGDRSADDSGVVGEGSLPVSIRQDRNRRCAASIILRREGAADGYSDTENIKEIV